LNISITPIECSVVCSKSWALQVFEPAIQRLSKDLQQHITISKDAYVIFSVSSAGMDAGRGVVDITAPLAMAGIPIFFITTYYTDFILVPANHRSSVTQALLGLGFEFSESDKAYVAPTSMSHSRALSGSMSPPSTPPPSNVAELQMRTFNQLRKRKVVPFVEQGLRLVQCSGTQPHDDYRPQSNGNGSSNLAHEGTWLDYIDSRLFVALIAAFSWQPRFLSVTLTRDDAPSLLLDKRLVPIFGDSIAGSTEGDLVPIFLDLVNLPLESTGIVCGVAGRVDDELRLHEPTGSHNSELSYLSTARAGAVILSSEVAMQAVEILHPLLEVDGSE
jgi:hypothetical protein